MTTKQRGKRSHRKRLMMAVKSQCLMRLSARENRINPFDFFGVFLSSVIIEETRINGFTNPPAPDQFSWQCATACVDQSPRNRETQTLCLASRAVTESG